MAGPLAARARGASRLLESQVGANARIRVQRDADFIPVTLNKSSPEEKEIMPAWVNSTLSCVAWEVQAAAAAAPTNGTDQNQNPKVVLAVLAIKEKVDLDDEDPQCLARFATRAGIEMIRIPGEPELHFIGGGGRGGRGNNRGRGERGRGIAPSARGRGAKVPVTIKDPHPPSPAPAFRLLARGERLSPEPA